MPSPQRKTSRPATTPERRPRGRPATERQEPLDTIQARVPIPLVAYMRLAATVPSAPGKAAPRTALAFHELALGRFLSERPWRRGLPWREGKAVSAPGADAGEDGVLWRQINIALPESLADKIRIVAARENRSVASLCLTAFEWWARYVCPPAGAPSDPPLSPRANGKSDEPLGVAPITDPKLFAELMVALGKGAPTKTVNPQVAAVTGTLAALDRLLDGAIGAAIPVRLTLAGYQALRFAAEEADLRAADPTAVEILLSEAQLADALRSVGLPADLRGAAAAAALAARCEEIGGLGGELRSAIAAGAATTTPAKAVRRKKAPASH